MKNKAEKIMKILAAALTAFLALCVCKLPALAGYDFIPTDEDSVVLVVVFGGALIIILAVVISVVSSVVSSIASAVDDEDD